MVHFPKLYSSFHKFVYHLELLKIFLNQYGKEYVICHENLSHLYVGNGNVRHKD